MKKGGCRMILSCRVNNLILVRYRVFLLRVLVILVYIKIIKYLLLILDKGLSMKI